VSILSNTARLVVVGVVIAAAAGRARAAEAELQADTGCRSVEDPLEELLEDPEQCRPRPQIKLRKVYPIRQGTARRRGLSQPITTLFNVHTRESLPFFGDLPPSAEVLGEFFRCRGFAFHKTIDPRLLKTVLAAAKKFESPLVRVISAFRSPKFNDALAKKGRGVASESRHTRGEAIDFGLPTAKAAEIGSWVWENFEGGVGVYAKDNFVHIDVGPKRRWTGD
jgi:hypothetical protein